MKKAIQSIEAFADRPWVSRIIPWLSLGFGISGGVAMTREFKAGLSNLLLLGLGGFITTVIFELIHEYHIQVPSSDSTEGETNGKKSSLSSPGTLFTWATKTASRNLNQYILMYCIPFTVFAGYWLSAVISACLVSLTLWDSWWEYLASNRFLSTLLRAWSGLLAVCFALPIGWPKGLPYFTGIAATSVLALSLPFHRLRFPKKIKKADWHPFLVILTISVIWMTGSVPPKFSLPVLSVWVRNPNFALRSQGASSHTQWSTIPEDYSKEKFIDDIQNNSQEFCCVSPIVAPPGFATPIQHIWLINGQEIDKITLAPIHGQSLDQAYRTFSCKRHLPSVVKGDQITCVISLAAGVTLTKITSNLR